MFPESHLSQETSRNLNKSAHKRWFLLKSSTRNRVFERPLPCCLLLLFLPIEQYRRRSLGAFALIPKADQQDSFLAGRTPVREREGGQGWTSSPKLSSIRIYLQRIVFTSRGLQHILQCCFRKWVFWDLCFC